MVDFNKHLKATNESHEETKAMTQELQVDQYCQTPLSGDDGQGEGCYRAIPVAWTLESSPKDDSRSVAIAFKFGIASRWDPVAKGWSEAWPAGYFVENRTWIVKKNGDVNEGAIANLAKCGLWNGDAELIQQGPPPQNVFVLLTVEADVYEGKTKYRANWINANADEPPTRGGFKPADPNLVQLLGKVHGTKMRAIAGGTPTGAAPAPPTPAVAAVPQPAVAPQPGVAVQPQVAQPQAAVAPQPVAAVAPQPGVAAPPVAPVAVVPSPMEGGVATPMQAAAAAPPVVAAPGPPAAPGAPPAPAGTAELLDEADAPF